MLFTIKIIIIIIIIIPVSGFLRCGSGTTIRHKNNKNQTPWPESVSEIYRSSDRSLPAKLVPTIADRGCHVVSVTDPYGRNLGFLEPLLFLPSSSSVVLTRLSGPRSRSTTSLKIW
jgi:hypothetical protein